MLGLGLNLGLSASGSGLPAIAGYRPLFYLTPYRDEDKTFTRASTATYIAADDGIESAAINVLRDRDHSNGAAAILMESQKVNKCEHYNANPTDLTNVTKVGDAAATLTVVDDVDALADAGLDGICTSGKVYMLDNSAGAAFASARIDGAVGNTNTNTHSAYVRGTGAIVVTGGGIREDFDNLSGYQRVQVSGVPSDTTQRAVILCDAGETAYFILNQLEEAGVATSPIITEGAASTRAADIATFDISSLSLGSGFWVVLKGFRLDGVDGTTDRILQLDDGVNNNRNAIAYVASSGNLQALQRDGTNKAIETKSYTLGDKATIAVRFKEHEFAVVWPDGVIEEDGDCTYVTPDQILLAANNTSGNAKPSRVSVDEVALYDPNITPAEMKSALGL